MVRVDGLDSVRWGIVRWVKTIHVSPISHEIYHRSAVLWNLWKLFPKQKFHRYNSNGAIFHIFTWFILINFTFKELNDLCELNIVFHESLIIFQRANRSNDVHTVFGEINTNNSSSDDGGGRNKNSKWQNALWISCHHKLRALEGTFYQEKTMRSNEFEFEWQVIALFTRRIHTFSGTDTERHVRSLMNL